MLRVAHFDIRPLATAFKQPTRVRTHLRGIFRAEIISNPKSQNHKLNSGAELLPLHVEFWQRADCEADDSATMLDELIAKCDREADRSVTFFEVEPKGVFDLFLQYLAQLPPLVVEVDSWKNLDEKELSGKRGGMFERVKNELKSFRDLANSKIWDSWQDQNKTADATAIVSAKADITAKANRLRDAAHQFTLIEVLDRLARADRSGAPRHAAILLAPPGASPSFRNLDLWALALEDADRMDRPLIEATIDALRRCGVPRVEVDGLSEVPEVMRDWTPSYGREASVRDRILAKVYSGIGTDDKPVYEIRNPQVREVFTKLQDRLAPLPLDADGYGDKLGDDEEAAIRHARAVTLHVMKVCRQLSTYTLEGAAFECNVLITRGGRRDQPVPGFGDLQFHTCFRPDPPAPFAVSGHLLRAYSELAQGEQTVMAVDADTCRLTEVFVIRCGSREHTRRYLLCGTAARHRGLTVHVRGGGLVEVYDEGNLQLWYDGFRWARQPFERLAEFLSRFFTRPEGGGPPKSDPPEAETPEQQQVRMNREAAERKEWVHGIVRRVIGGVMSLIDRRASSILVFTTLAGWKTIAPEAKPNDVAYMVHVNAARKGELVRVGGTVPDAKTLIPLSALVGLLRVDGAHVLLDDGSVAGVGYRVIGRSTADPSNTEANGTGTQAAQELSERLSGPEGVADGTTFPGLVLKVSADRKVHVFWGGSEV